MGVNRVFLLGNLGADPELRYTTSQHPVCTLRVATGERRRNAEGEWVDHTEWHSVVAWGKTAENCSQYLNKGSQVFVEGRIQTRKWQDQEGKDRYKTEIVAANVQFVGRRGESGLSSNIEVAPAEGEQFGGFDAPPAAEAKPKGKASSAEVTFDDDDIPF